MMPQDQKIDYIEFPAADFDAIQAFYEQAFNWEFMDYGPEYRSFTDGRVDGGFRHANQKSSPENGAALVILYAENLEATRDKVVSSGGEIIEDIFSFPGGRRFQFADPNGNELAVWSEK
jgi:predicted enzyme related to lactoylglutathione lyase